MTKRVVQGRMLYEVIKLLGETASYRFYKVTTPEVESPLVLKIASEVAGNGVLDREAYLLGRMRQHALTLEREYQGMHPDKYLNYQLAFPYVRETFIATNQGGRRVQILEIEAARALEDLTALSLIRTRDCVRVDHKTAAWILGKSLKILAFAHDFGVSVGNFGGDDIVIDRNDHMVMIFDWAHAVRMSDGVVGRDTVAREMYVLAKEAALVMGGNPDPFELPASDDDPGAQFQAFVRKLGRGEFASTALAHKAFYQMVEAVWGRKFHPYTSVPL